MLEFVHRKKACSLFIEWKETIHLWNVRLTSLGVMDPELEFLESMIHTNFSSFQNIPSHHTGIIKIMTWNCGGAGSIDFRRHVKELLCNHKPEVAVILESGVHDKKALQVFAKIGFKGSIKSCRGIWILWNSDLLDIQCSEDKHTLFKAFIFEDDKESGLWNNCSKIANFNSNVSGSMRSGYFGPAFTWNNNIGEVEWRLLYHQNEVTFILN